MRTLLLLATAATLAWTASDAQAQGHSDRRVVVVQSDHHDEDGDVFVSGDDRVVAERDYRRTGRWVEGEWTPDRRRFEGVYEVDEDDRDVGPPPRRARHDDRHSDRSGARFDERESGWQRSRFSDEDMMRRCRADNGLGGAAMGAAAGGVLGNRVAGRGNRRVGTAAGVVAGAALGAAIDRNEDRRACAAWYRDYESRRSFERDGDQGGFEGEGWGGGYGGGTTTIVIPGQPVIIEETETFYETVTVAAPRQRVRHRAAPRRAAHRPARRQPCRCR